MRQITMAANTLRRMKYTVSFSIEGVVSTGVKEDVETDKGTEEVGKMQTGKKEEPSLILEIVVMTWVTDNIEGEEELE